jgi:hypothetical protein
VTLDRYSAILKKAAAEKYRISLINGDRAKPGTSSQMQLAESIAKRNPRAS